MGVYREWPAGFKLQVLYYARHTLPEMGHLRSLLAHLRPFFVMARRLFPPSIWKFCAKPVGALQRAVTGKRFDGKYLVKIMCS
jgi:hypothetical protein